MTSSRRSHRAQRQLLLRHMKNNRFPAKRRKTKRNRLKWNESRFGVSFELFIGVLSISKTTLLASKMLIWRPRRQSPGKVKRKLIKWPKWGGELLHRKNKLFLYFFHLFSLKNISTCNRVQSLSPLRHISLAKVKGSVFNCWQVKRLVSPEE